jgi:hypothetical protein
MLTDVSEVRTAALTSETSVNFYETTWRNIPYSPPWEHEISPNFISFHVVVFLLLHLVSPVPASLMYLSSGSSAPMIFQISCPLVFIACVPFCLHCCLFLFTQNTEGPAKSIKQKLHLGGLILLQPFCLVSDVSLSYQNMEVAVFIIKFYFCIDPAFLF